MRTRSGWVGAKSKQDAFFEVRHKKQLHVGTSCFLPYPLSPLTVKSFLRVMLKA